MVWRIEDKYGVEDRLEAMGEPVWTNWLELVRPHLLEDPSPTNDNLKIDETHDDQVWIPETNVYVLFESDRYCVYLINAVDIFDEAT